MPEQAITDEQEPETNFRERVGKNKDKPVYSAYVGNGVQLSVWANDGAKGEFVNGQIVHKYKDASGQEQIQKVSIPADALASLSIRAADAHKAAEQERYEQYKRSKGQER